MGIDAAWQLLDQNCIANQGMQRTNAKRPHFMAAPLSLSSKTGSFASPPRDGFALYYVSTVTSTLRLT
jgi:hypothetical protein